MSDAFAERVLVVPTELFHRLGHFQGFCDCVDRYLAELFSPEHISYRPRDEVEEDPSFKQLIPYVIFRHEDDTGRLSVFQYTRGTGQGEGRLHRKRSVGIGGHISTVDCDARRQRRSVPRTACAANWRRKSASTRPTRARCVGLINDDQTEVGRVHLGVVHLFDVERPAVRPARDGHHRVRLPPVDEILADLAGFETWSQICMTACLAR